MVSQDDLRIWIKSNYPLFWSLLNKKAQRSLPKGLVEYIGDGTQSEIETGRDHLSSVEKHLANLVNKCGLQNVVDNYRHDLSGVNSENQVAELFCEISLCASLGEYSQDLKLRPPTGKGTHSDGLFNMCSINIYGEAKRYVDPWPHIETIGDNSKKKVSYKRSILQAPSDKKRNDSARPRSMDLRSKLRDVHRQLPDGTVNILFVFHSSLGESQKYITQALFGDSNFFETIPDYTLEKEGLFSIDEWQNISACCLVRVNPDSKVVFPFLWKNPRACIELPESVFIKLKA